MPQHNIHPTAFAPSETPTPTTTPITGATTTAASTAAAGTTAAAPPPGQTAFLDLDQADQAAAATNTGQVSDIDMVVRFVIWTVIVLCLCVLTVLGLRRWQKKQGILPVSQGNSRVLETVALGANRSISLVQLRDIQALVGCDASGIQSIVLAPPPFDASLAETDIPAEEFATTPIREM
ncbi:MAG: flagellar biosynthetic protein FliO [Fuerstiella sp.]